MPKEKTEKKEEKVEKRHYKPCVLESMKKEAKRRNADSE